MVLLCFFSCRSVSAQPVAHRFPERYQQVIDAYQAGFTSEAVASVLALDAGTYQGVHRALSLIEKGLRGDATVALALQTASMLHLDAALRCWEVANEQDARSQIELARRIVDLSAAASTPDTFRRRWYLATALTLSGVLVPAEASAYFEDAVQALPDDVPLLTAAGWFSERRSLGAAAPEATPAMQQRSRRIHRQSAERYLARALKADPAAAEAALRLARLDVTAGRDADARTRLTSVLARPGLESWVAYVGRLLLGGIHERQSDAVAAERVYREALAFDEVAQSARIALSHLLYASGDAEAAAAVVEPLGTPVGRRQRNDPWADYQLGYLPIGRALLEELRNEVRR